MNRRFLHTALAIALALAAFATTMLNPGAQAQQRSAPDRLELTSLADAQKTIRFTLYDEASNEIAAGEMSEDAARRSQTLTVSKRGATLAEITRQNPDSQHLQVTVEAGNITTIFNFDLKELSALYERLAKDAEVKTLDSDQLHTLKEVGQLRHTMIAAIGADLYLRLSRAISESNNDSIESQSLAVALGARTGADARVGDCLRVSQAFYHLCLRNGNTEGACILYALEEFLDCITWQPET